MWPRKVLLLRPRPVRPIRICSFDTMSYDPILLEDDTLRRVFQFEVVEMFRVVFDAVFRKINIDDSLSWTTIQREVEVFLWLAIFVEQCDSERHRVAHECISSEPFQFRLSFFVDIGYPILRVSYIVRNSSKAYLSSCELGGFAFLDR